MRLGSRTARLPVRFEPNQGQFDKGVSFVARSGGYALFLTEDRVTLAVRGRADPGEADLAGRSHKRSRIDSSVATKRRQSLESAVVSMRVLGGRSVKPLGMEQAPERSNYFGGSDRSKWRQGVEAFARVKYSAVKPGVDLVFYGDGQQALEYDLVVAPGVDASSLGLLFEGARAIEVDRAGDLVLKVAGGEIQQPPPIAYQQLATGDRSPVSVRYRKRGDGAIGFALGPYDRHRELVIDPTLLYSTYLGGSSGLDTGTGIAVNSAGFVYVTGYTYSTDFPTLTPGQAVNRGTSDVFVTKLTSAGQLVYSTYLGGASVDNSFAIAADTAGFAYVTGRTFSTDFPTMSPVQASNRGLGDGFVAKLNTAGALVYSTYLGGTDSDECTGIALDGAGSIYVAGTTSSTDFSTLNPFHATNGGLSDAFVTKLNSAGALVYSTYLGGSADDGANDVAVDAAGSAYVAGSTTSGNFPTLNPIQATRAGAENAFITKLSASGSALTYSTYLGGSTDSGDFAFGIAVDATGAAYVTGLAASANFPTTATAFQRIKRASSLSWNAFVSKLAPAGTSLAYSSYLGGTCGDWGSRIAVDSNGQAYVAGQTCSPDFPNVAGVQAAFQGPINDPQAEAFVTKVAANGSSLVYSTYLGGRDEDFAAGIALDGAQVAYVTGWTLSDNFPATPSALQRQPLALQTAFVTRLGPNPLSVPAGSPLSSALLGVMLLVCSVCALIRKRRVV